MTVCAGPCGRDKHVGRVNGAGDFICGACDPQASVAQRPTLGARLSFPQRRRA